jgi:tRNA pseudouridine55 synthase
LVSSFVLPVDKPVGPTSHDIVAQARRALGTKRIGHTGTLDPFASGLLLLCVNNATRLAEYFGELPKSYLATARFDGATTTDDCTGDFITRSTDWQTLDEEQVRAAFQTQRGTLAQLPSKFSAKKVAGERAYDIARRGDAVDLSPAEVTIYDIRVLAITLPEVTFEVDCSSGTYVRAVARDVGEALRTGGHLTSLRRTAIGRVRVDDAAPADAITAERGIPMLSAIGHLPILHVDDDEVKALRFGQALNRAVEPGTLAIEQGGELIGIAVSDGERVRPKKVFAID